MWLLIGPNYSGKTTFARWAAERMLAAKRSALLAALDPLNRTLTDFFEGVEQPASADPSLTPGWLRALVEHLMRERLPAIADMGGGDTSLARLIADLPALAQTMEEAGIAPVASYFLGPRVDDLSSLATFEASGFRPRSTVLILNTARVDAGLDPGEAFAAIQRHSVFRAAVSRGAIMVEMPRLDPPELALEVERKRLGFGAARDGEGGLGPLDRAGVRAWMDRMERAFAPVDSWLP
ncbi:ATP-binding protein [Roseomonas stagni]|uniref:ATP-binding protein n=1 Tax=Falsiroseomonas algicola TaxID=2716930 RepID=A0A6M1LU16_9PROT|nr:ATP-binding protein [Falsiroseomonas algicola]NGM23958.1 ATP-binding protein [Falsiroseomonas algicola]